MAQHDYNIADQPGLAFLADLNSALEAAVTLNSGATEPTTTYAGMLWLDTSGDSPVIKQRNKDNNGWDTLSSLIDAEVMPSPTAGGYVKRKSDNTGNETKTAQQVADEIAPLLNVASLVPPATTSTAGIVELATDGEAQAFTADKVIDGARLASAFKGANQSLSTNGYQKLPGGLIFQWGRTGYVPRLTQVNVTFPIAFPSACIASSGIAIVDASSEGSVVSHVGYPTKSGMTFHNGDQNTDYESIFWQAIGY